MTRILITGATGLLGLALAPEAIQRRHAMTGVHHRSKKPATSGDYVSVDLTEKEAAGRLLDRVKPEIILHSAAATDVERCQTDPAWAKAINVQATATLADWAASHNAALAYISTDSIFNGQRGGYVESDASDPLNYYAKTKWQGEEVVRAAGPNHLILRTNFYGWGVGDKLSLGEWVLRGLMQQTPIKTFTDVRFSPLFTGDLARVIFDLIDAGARGTFHVGSREACSKHEFAQLVADTFGLHSRMTPVSVDTFRFHAPRPKDTSLNVTKVSDFLRRPMPGLAEGMKAFKKQFDDGNILRNTSAWHASSI